MTPCSQKWRSCAASRTRPFPPSRKPGCAPGMRRLEDTADPIHGRKKDEGYVLPRPLQVGDTVLIFDIDKKATVLELPKDGDQVLVQAGIIKTRVPMSNLRLVKEPPKEAAPGPNRRQRRVTRSVARGAQGQETPQAVPSMRWI